jgi:hypothetical protein
MKKLVQWVLFAFLGILPALGLDDDAFLNQPGATYRATFNEEEGEDGKVRLFASVKASFPDGTIMRRRVSASFKPAEWFHYDREDWLFSKRTGVAYIMCNDEEIGASYTRSVQHPYELLRESSVNLLGGVSTPDEELPLGIKIGVATQKEFRRVDGSLYRLLSEPADALTVAMLKEDIIPQETLLDLPSGTVLNVFKDVNRVAGAADRWFIYQLLIKENSVAKGTIYQCFQEGEEWQQRGLNRYRQLRHWWKQFNGIEVTRAAYRVVGGIETPVLGLSKSELQLFTVKTEGGRENHAECPAPYGRNLPPNSRIVG